MARRYHDDHDEDDDIDDYVDPQARRRRRQARRDKKNRTLYILLAAGAVTLLFCGGVAWFVASAVKEVARATRQLGPPAPGDEAGPPAYHLSAEDLYRAFEKNEARAEGKYGGESVRVNGTVAAVEQIPGIGWRVALATGRNHARVHAEFDPNKGHLVSRLTPGQPCSVVGVCDGKVPDPTGAGLWVVTLFACRLAD